MRGVVVGFVDRGYKTLGAYFFLLLPLKMAGHAAAKRPTHQRGLAADEASPATSEQERRDEILDRTGDPRYDIF